MTEDEDWREMFVPTELLASNTLDGPLPLRLLVRIFSLHGVPLSTVFLLGAAYFFLRKVAVARARASPDHELRC